MYNRKKTLLILARSAISEVLGLPYRINLEQLIRDNFWLKKKGASFVTISTKNRQLRGCVGSIVAHRKLYLDVMHNAKSAAMNDPRFPSLSVNEFEDIKIEVSVLTEPKILLYDSIDMLKSKIRVGIDGVILKQGTHQATFLPQVWEDLPTFESFFAHLCQKSGMKEDCLNDMPDIFIYQVKIYSET